MAASCIVSDTESKKPNPLLAGWKSTRLSATLTKSLLISFLIASKDSSLTSESLDFLICSMLLNCGDTLDRIMPTP